MTLVQRDVAENVAYRFKDQRYSVADEYGDHDYTSYEAKLLVYPIIKYTPCGYWIWTNYAIYPQLPFEYNPYKDYLLGEKRFVNLQANKKFALPTIPEALESYRARKDREIAIYTARIKGAKNHLRAAVEIYHRVPEGLKQTSEKDVLAWVSERNPLII